ncbi:xanthine dehydrogenase/oxidase-like [Glandiceps talaboti]
MAMAARLLRDGQQAPDQLIFFVNGKKITNGDIDPETTLLSYLRNKLHLTGSKLGCGEGGCGACTVMLSRYDHQNKKILHQAINACYTPTCAVHGMAVTTVEGIGSSKTKLHPIQERLAKAHGMQCGFCTPGMVMSMYALLRSSPEPVTKDIEGAIKGNLCRCTGYRPILEGFNTFAVNGCCGDPSACGMGANDATNINRSAFPNINAFERYDPTQEPIFPPELQLDDRYNSTTVHFIGKYVTWIRPVTLDELLMYKSDTPDARLVVGNAEVVFEMRKQHKKTLTLLSARHIPELNKIEITDDVIIFGASVSMTSVQQTLKKAVEEIPQHKGRIYNALVEMLDDVGGVQVKNVAGIGSHIMSASPLSDIIPLLMAAGTTVMVASKKGGCRQLTLDKTFFTGLRTTCLMKDEILLSVSVPTTKEHEHFAGYKVKDQVHRNDKDIAMVNAGMRVLFEDHSDSIREISLSFGGTGPTVILATGISNRMSARKWNNELLEDVLRMLSKDLALSSSGGMVEYRRSLLQSFFFKFYLKVLHELNCENSSTVTVPETYQSAINIMESQSVLGTQFVQAANTESSIDPIGQPVMNESGIQIVTGEAVYCDDVPPEPEELCFAFVTSTKAHAKIVKIDSTEALALEGVHAFVGAEDVPGSNAWSARNPKNPDEELFATNEVKHVGQPIGGIVAKGFALARKAAMLVKVDYEDMENILTINDAIQKESYLHPFLHHENGNVEQELEKSDYVIEGEIYMGGQSHFYMETQSCIAKPQERGEMLIIGSSQNLMALQMVVAKALGVPANKVICKVRRLGGGFGGKLFGPVRVIPACAVAAKKAGKPVRMVLTRQEDMQIIGTRHPAFARYKVGFSATGQLRVMEADVYLNGGCTTDVSHSVCDHVLGQINNAYKVPFYRVAVKLCMTNIASCTAMRGFGLPKGMMVIETIIDHVAQKCGLPPEQVREVNLLRKGDVDIFCHELPDIENLKRCWTECIEKSDFENRKREVDLFNSENRWKKRGIVLVPQKCQIGFPANCLNQGAALAHIYTDGSVLLTHGGIEMGQGLHTKTIQIASRVLRIPCERIQVNETSTDKVPNATLSGASAGTDLFGNAVKVACETLMERLEPIINENPKGTWEEWISAAYFNRVSLSATGYYKVPKELNFYPNNIHESCTNYYFSYGAACCEVEIDCLTGDHQLKSADIVMDVGESLNPALDIGQIEGGFIQGYGLYVLEELRYSKSGKLLTRGPGMYNVPRVGDMPSHFNVVFLDGAPCKDGVFSSKAMGEPPLLLGTAVLMAIKNAIMSARSDAGLSGYFRLDSPATSERIRLACIDKFTDKAKESSKSEDCFFVRP